jgi:putative oxidoreductase
MKARRAGHVRNMDLALFVLRVVVGAFFIGHGAQKVSGAFGGHGPAATAQAFHAMGMRPGRLNARIAAGAELAGGALLVLGLMTPLAATLVIAVMAVAIIVVHARNGPWATAGGYEYNAVLAAAAFALAGAGPGDWSLDSAIGWDVAGPEWALGALALGLIGAAAAVARARALPAGGGPAGPPAARAEDTVAAADAVQSAVAHDARDERLAPRADAPAGGPGTPSGPAVP